jgi:hypothetical protein
MDTRFIQTGSRSRSAGGACGGIYAQDAAAVYAVGRPSSAEVQPANPFRETSDVTLPRRGAAPGLDVFAVNARRVSRYFDEAADTAIYFVGRAIHPALAGDALLRWCGQAVHGDPAGFRALHAPFVILIDDRRRRRIHFVSDCLGLQPWFAGSFGGRLVAGTEVLGIGEAGLASGEVDYDSVASWLIYHFTCTGGSVAADYRRVANGAVSAFDPCGCLAGETVYAKVSYVRDVVPPDQLVEALYERAGQSFDRLVRGLDEVNLPLSGGYDSRLLCALAVDRGLRANVTLVDSRPQEREGAVEAARALGVPLRIVPTGPRKVDLFDDPLFFMAEGFPSPRNLTNAIARLHPGMPLLSGFLGDGMMRGGLTAGYQNYLKQDEAGLDDEALAHAVHDFSFLETNKHHLLRTPIVDRAIARAKAALSPVIRQGRIAGRPLMYSTLRLTQCRYLSNIFLSHQAVTDALLPYCTWDLVEFNAAHTGSFDAETYPRLFRRYFPRLDGIAHSLRRQIPPAPRQPANAGPTRHLRSWASELLRGVPRKWHETAITPSKLLRRLPAGLLVQDGPHVDELGFLHRIHAFEERARRANLILDWSRM